MAFIPTCECFIFFSPHRAEEGVRAAWWAPGSQPESAPHARSALPWRCRTQAHVLQANLSCL